MKVYIVCRSWCYGHEDRGWAIMGTFFSEVAAYKEMNIQYGKDNDKDHHWYVEELEVRVGA